MREFRSRIFGEHDPYKDLNPMPADFQGWASDRPVFREVLTELKPKFIVEVGTWKGSSAFHMADILLEIGHRDFEIVCVDTWLGSVEHWTQLYGPIHPILKNGRPQLYEQFLSNVMHFCSLFFHFMRQGSSTFNNYSADILFWQYNIN